MEHSIQTIVRSELRDGKGYRLKVSVLDLGIYIDGFRALQSSRNESGWWVQPPSNLIKGSWIEPCEFDKTKAFWQNIEQSCIDAINVYLSEDREHAQSTTSKDVLPTDDEMAQVFQEGIKFPDDWNDTPPKVDRQYHP